MKPLFRHLHHAVVVRERTAIFRTAWDFAGSALAGRVELCERFYLASSHRMFQVAHAASVRESDFALVDSVLRPN